MALIMMREDNVFKLNYSFLSLNHSFFSHESIVTVASYDKATDDLKHQEVLRLLSFILDETNSFIVIKERSGSLELSCGHLARVPPLSRSL
jgi:hypothetical protein